MKVYNKLVRDKIPQIIEEEGKKYDIRIAEKEEIYTLLEDKLKEEVAEFIKDKNLAELADIMEVIIGLAKNLGHSEEELMKKRIEKREERGGFERGIVLEQVHDMEKAIIYCSNKKNYNFLMDKFKNNMKQVDIISINKEEINQNTLNLYKSVEATDKTDIVFIVAALEEELEVDVAKCISKFYREKNIFTIAIGTMPLNKNNHLKRETANKQIIELKDSIDSLILIDSEKIDSNNYELDTIKNLTEKAVVDAISNIIDTVCIPGLINLELEDIRKIMGGNRISYVTVGTSKGANKAQLAAKEALKSPAILENTNKAKGILFTVYGNKKIQLSEINDVAEEIINVANSDNNIFFGAVIDEKLDDEIKVGIIVSVD